jgi:CARDB
VLDSPDVWTFRGSVFERDRTDTDAIEFDFFDDAPTTEAARETAPPRRRRRLPTRPPTGTGGPLVRLGALIVGAILLTVVLVLWVNSCREGQRRDAYRDYMGTVAKVGGDSQRIGRDFNSLLFSAGIQVDDLQKGVDGLRQAQIQTVERAQELDPPGPLREQHESLVEALQLRVSGLNGLTRAFTQITDTRNSQEAGEALAEQSNRLVASDVLYDDFFKVGSQDVMEEEGIRGVPVPDSNFVANLDLGSPSSWKLIVDRLTKPVAAGGLRGNRIEGVRVLPARTQLSPSEENTVKASDRLAFEVLVNNSGESQETQVKVNLTIQQSPDPIRQEEQIDSINPGQTKSVVFRELGQVSFGSNTILKVTVEPVAGEKNTNNNTAEYVVIFTFG